MHERSDRPADARFGKPATVPYQTVYHWDRIAVAAVIAVALLAGLVYLGTRLFGEEAPGEIAAGTTGEQPALPSGTATGPASASEPMPAANEPAPAVSEPPSGASNPPPATTAGDEPAAQLPEPESAVASEPSAEIAPPAPGSPAAVDPAPAETAPAPTVAAPRGASPASPAPADNETSASSSPTTAPIQSAAGSLPQLANIKVETPSAAVVRAQFAAGVRDNEPAGEVAAIEPTASGLIRLYFFTEVKGRKGDRLTYRWLRDGNRVATVPAGAWNNAWRSYSSKFIAPTQQGHWRVELVDHRGAVLAVGSFDYLGNGR